MTAGGSGSIAGYGEQGADNHDEVRANILAEVQAATVTLHAGEALFLPAGWAHQVTSVAGGDGLHAAVNTWFGAPTSDLVPHLLGGLESRVWGVWGVVVWSRLTHQTLGSRLTAHAAKN